MLLAYVPAEKIKKAPKKKRRIGRDILDKMHALFGSPPWDPDDFDALSSETQDAAVMHNIHPINKTLKERKNTSPINRLKLPYRIRMLLYRIAVVAGIDVIMELLSQKEGLTEENIRSYLKEKHPHIFRVVFGLTDEELATILKKALKDLDDGKPWEEVVEKLPEKVKRKIYMVMELLGDSFGASHLRRLLENELKKL